MPQYRIGEDIYDFDLGEWTQPEWAAVKRALGVGIVEFQKMFKEMDPDALQAFIWTLRKRREPSLRIGDVGFTLNEFSASTLLKDEEIREVWPTLEKEARPAMLAELPEDTRERLFDEEGNLRAVVPVPLDVQDSSEIPTT